MFHHQAEKYVILICNIALNLQIKDFLEGVAEEHGKITGVTNLIGNMCIKPAHLTSDEEVRLKSILPVVSTATLNKISIVEQF